MVEQFSFPSQTTLSTNVKHLTSVKQNKEAINIKTLLLRFGEIDQNVWPDS